MVTYYWFSALVGDDLTEECYGDGCGECSWHGGDGQWSLVGDGHSESDCKNECAAIAECNYASLSGLGYCHMSETCATKSGSGWTRWHKKGSGMSLK